MRALTTLLASGRQGPGRQATMRRRRRSSLGGGGALAAQPEAVGGEGLSPGPGSGQALGAAGAGAGAAAAAPSEARSRRRSRAGPEGGALAVGFAAEAGGGGQASAGGGGGGRSPPRSSLAGDGEGERGGKSSWEESPQLPAARVRGGGGGAQGPPPDVATVLRYHGPSPGVKAAGGGARDSEASGVRWAAEGEGEGCAPSHALTQRLAAPGPAGGGGGGGRGAWQASRPVSPLEPELRVRGGGFRGF